MDLELSTIQRLRRQHRALLERVDEVRGWAKRQPSRPSEQAVRALRRLASQLAAVAPAHLKEEGCLSCSNFRACRSVVGAVGASCGTEKPRAPAGEGEHLLGLIQALGQAAGLEGGPPGEPERWREALGLFGEVEQALRAHVSALEESFRAAVLGKPSRARAG